ncbi:hypothetical protein G4B88_015042 [Cannabis sativa]|uniref:Uncharacterized protein n=1 Tax=Cannabis sativa TaxID=3483 RepID=A0A7J6E176_CANSA|nr:hypothetical protein G4B88_015042 [Cannabis sativa]
MSIGLDYFCCRSEFLFHYTSFLADYYLESVMRARILSITFFINKSIEELEYEMDHLGRPIVVDAGEDSRSLKKGANIQKNLPKQECPKIPKSGLTIIAFLTLSRFFNRYGLRQLLFLDCLDEDSIDIRGGGFFTHITMNHLE